MVLTFATTLTCTAVTISRNLKTTWPLNPATISNVTGFEHRHNCLYHSKPKRQVDPALKGFSFRRRLGTAPLSNRWIINKKRLCTALKRTPNMDCYWEGAVPKVEASCNASTTTTAECHEHWDAEASNPERLKPGIPRTTRNLALGELRTAKLPVVPSDR